MLGGRLTLHNYSLANLNTSNRRSIHQRRHYPSLAICKSQHKALYADSQPTTNLDLASGSLHIPSSGMYDGYIPVTSPAVTHSATKNSATMNSTTMNSTTKNSTTMNSTTMNSTTMINFHKVCRTIQTFRNYGEDAEDAFITPRAELFASLSEDDKAVVTEIWHRKEMALRQAVNSNAELAKAIAEYSVDFFSNQGCQEDMQRLDYEDFGSTNEDKAIARSAIRQIWRDWSFEATAERNACFQPIMEDIVQRYQGCKRSRVKILIPGSGLNRLGFNLSRAGFDVEANEVSYIHLLATNFILSRTNNGGGTCQRPGFLGNIEAKGAQSVFNICPWALSFSNHIKTEHQFTKYTVPEIMPASPSYLGSPPTLDTAANSLAFKTQRFSVNGNNFMTDYTDPSTAGQYDVVVTCFFIDTAPNFLSYVRTIKHLLKPGGTWINTGPLLWNCYENGPGGRREGDIDIDEDTQARQQPPQQGSLRPVERDVGEAWDRKLEFSHEEVLAVLERMGFCVHQDRDVGTAGYCFDKRGMMDTEYRLRFWVAVNGQLGEGHPVPNVEQTEGA